MPSSVEYLSTRLYSSSIVRGGSNDSDWKKGLSVQSCFESSEGQLPCCMHRFVGQLVLTSW